MAAGGGEDHAVPADKGEGAGGDCEPAVSSDVSVDWPRGGGGEDRAVPADKGEGAGGDYEPAVMYTIYYGICYICICGVYVIHVYHALLV